MGRGRGLVAVTLGAAVLTALPPEAGAAPPSAAAGARFTGESVLGGTRGLVRFNSTGTRIVDHDLNARVPCSDGMIRVRGLRGKRPIAVTPNGTFFSGPAPATFSGSIVNRDVLIVSMGGQFTAERPSCRGGTSFSLYRVGRPQARERDGVVAAGRYRASGRGINVLRLTVEPGRYVSALRYSLTVPCRNGSSVKRKGTFPPFFLDRAGDSAYEASTGRTALSIRFAMRRGVYRVSGRIRATSTARGLRCSTSRSFSGRSAG